MSAIRVEDDIEDFVQSLQFAAEHIGPQYKHVAVKLLAPSCNESDHRVHEDLRVDLQRYKDVFGTKYGFYTETLITPKIFCHTDLLKLMRNAATEQSETRGRPTQMRMFIAITTTKLFQITGLLILVFLGLGNNVLRPS